MTPGQIELHGTLRADGTLILDEKPNLPPGRVRVVVQPLAGTPAKPDPWAVLQGIWAERRALGLQPRSAEEIDAEINSLRDEWEERQQALERIQEDARRGRGKPSC
jgi:hypothetical protein